MRLQMRREESPSAQTALASAVNRIMGMVEVHNLLAKSTDKINIKELLSSLLETNIQTFLMPGQVIKTKVSGADISLTADRSLSIALVANELIINAIKHAFSGRDRGRLDATVERGDDGIVISLKDDGNGLSPDFNITGSANLGLKLVRSVVEDDLSGEFILRNYIANPVRSPSRSTRPVRNFSGGKYDANLDEKPTTKDISNGVRDDSRHGRLTSNGANKISGVVAEIKIPR